MLYVHLLYISHGSTDPIVNSEKRCIGYVQKM
jgi:hypothetical protein